MTDIARQINQQIKQVLKQIQQAEFDYNRIPGSVKLLAVSKGQTIDNLQAAIAAGQTAFGENYLQESLKKTSFFKDSKIEWHFIGRLQSNKAKAIAENFSWVQGVENVKLAERLNAYRPLDRDRLNICIEVNVDEEKQKGGIVKSQVFKLAQEISHFPRLHLRGLMIIPKPTDDFQKQRLVFRQVFELQQALLSEGFDLDTLSMGMSNDFVAAIAEGSTMVRLGRVIFNPNIK